MGFSRSVVWRFVAIIILSVNVSTGIQAADTDRFVPNIGMGFTLTLPSSFTLKLPEELQAITVLQVFDSSNAKNKVEISSDVV